MGQPQEHHLTVTRQARYYTLGTPGAATREVWFALHGYGQLARYFIRHLRPLGDGSRLVVAPEALSRFYLDGGGAERRVGATWMTRESRLAEIADYIAYLDRLYAQVFAELDRAQTSVHVLAFSQGTATACRWLAEGAATADRLILWGGALPHDFDFERHRARLNELRLTIVAGTEDPYATPEKVREEEARLRQEAVAFESVTFDGGHRLDADVLRRLADEGGRPTD